VRERERERERKKEKKKDRKKDYVPSGGNGPVDVGLAVDAPLAD
jgi:hypothetical protein